MSQESKPADYQRSKWKKSKLLLGNLVGKVLESEEELKKLFSLEKITKAQERTRGCGYTTIYGQSAGSHYFEPYGYKCNSCEKIIVGPPIILDTEYEHQLNPVLRRESYDIFCESCKKPLHVHP
jgi:hypothetical protein